MTANPSQLSFETSLRKHRSVKAIETNPMEQTERTEKTFKRDHNEDFWSIPHKDKVGEIPEFLPPMASGGKRRISKLTKTLKNFKDLWKKGKTQPGNIKMLTAFEGPYAFPEYNQKLQENNIGSVVHLIRGVGGKALSTLKWESGLRTGYIPVK
mmetsp:Transcript_38365/g.43963  ORF Transcript_38365/g.43963 Transcript_38365/m.43963 type:complete len:154 (+) Transcript_38365:122-583(+)